MERLLHLQKNKVEQITLTDLRYNILRSTKLFRIEREDKQFQQLYSMSQVSIV